MNQTRLLSFGKTGSTVLSRIAGIFLLLFVSGNAFAGPADVADDGWRRTKNGWEHISQWQLSTKQLEGLTNPTIAPAVLSPSLDQLMTGFHPVIFALGIGLVGGMVLYSPRLAANLTLPSEFWRIQLQ
jgi:hypothetical protein